MRRDDFEDFLKLSSNELRMHPSSGVWNQISRHLHERRRRIGFISGAFLLIASVAGYFLIHTRDVVRPLATRASSNTAHYPISRNLPALLQNEQGVASAQPVSITRNNRVTSTTQRSFPSRQLQQAGIAPGLPSAVTVLKQADVEVETLPATGSVTLADESFVPAVIDDSFPGTEGNDRATSNETDKSSTNATPDAEKLLTIESVTNAFTRSPRQKKVSFQIFFTPTVSYRKLSENKAYLSSVPQSSAAINYAVLYNVNDAVTHKPDMGLELGFNAKYAVAKNIKLKGGLQFNMSRYDIKAFTYPTEVARIALNNSTYGVDYVGSTTNYRNFGGGNPDWLQNLYFQAAVPLGVEVKLAGKEGTSFGIGSTIQPTYILSDRAYMISTDYKNYTEVPWLVRRWNMNTSFETFVAYETGKMKWQVGPQIRYQILSSFVSKYPVRENLFDFGLKVGVSLNNTKKSSVQNQ